MSRSQIGVALSISAHALIGVIGANLVATSPRPAIAAREHAWEARPIDVEFIEPTALPRSATDATAKRAERPTTRVSRGDRVPHTTATAASAVAPHSFEPSPTPREHVHQVPALPSVQSIDHIAERAPTPTATPSVAVPARATFRMRVDRDGTAHLTDRPNLHFSVGTSAAEIEEGRAEEWLEAHHEQSNAVDMKVPPVGATIMRFDVTDWAMRVGGQDPYAYEKLKVLDATRDARAQIRARHREQQAMQTPALVRASLDSIAALAPGLRSAGLVELWRDCDDSKAGEIARATIVEYVRTRPALFSAADRAALAPD
jgi:hypothetical protein